jgi:biopolymer transport protein ExbD
MKLRSGNRPEPEVNLTSLIDVVLLLLVFFMVTTSFVRESELTIRLPEASNEEPAATDNENLQIVITAAGRYLVNGRALVDSRAVTLRAAVRKLQPEVAVGQVTISADAEASHQAVVTAMDVAGQLGFTQISIATVTEAEQAP